MLIIFDFDGVIVDSFAACYAIARLNEPDITDEQYRARFEGNINEAMKEAHKGIKKVVGDYAAEYSPRILEIRPIPAVEACIRSLATEHTLAIVSSSPVRSIESYLEKYGLASCFGEVVGNEAHPSKVVKIRMLLERQGVAAKKALFITDTLGDVREAAKVGVRTVAVSWGYNSDRTLISGSPDYLVLAPEQLGPLLSGFFVSS